MVVFHRCRKHTEGFGGFSICRGCGTLWYLDNYRWTREFKGKNLTYSVLKELQPNRPTPKGKNK